ncbi:S8 family serine peptidase [Roseomonas eburnea]|uniref:S8 family serine peptidase n=1 Tax=Neoroseomonas eburnea TaxID=1346889 RepID=A0A9X9X8X1_9PROT|nr:S8 family serine peptidase [Neoroseomonas eburnea]MBR0680157.1 S8 family serine peptidase [Neoroseomonas eburnea]
MEQDAGPVLLVKAAAVPRSFRLAMGADLPEVTATPLFRSIGPTAAGPGVAPAAAAQWFVLHAPLMAAPMSSWDLCHALLTDGFGVAGAPAPAFAEPDLTQRWIFGKDTSQAFALGAGCPAAGAPFDPRFPSGTTPLWYRDADHSQFDGAFDGAGGSPATVRVAHLDTGYDPAHDEVPARLRLDLQRNFVEADRPNDAADITEGVLTQLGHGTGTLGILAGRRVGAVPFAEVVPIRVADRVVLFRNSAIARALDHVHALCADPASFVHVITLSMGGIASQAWAEAVNALYERGVVMVAAAGNNFGNLPTRHIVYPARFGRVLAACGVMADGMPYADLGLDRMAGNYGPAQKMATAVAACTPNLPWARLGCPAIVDGDGAGTSSATPQVAAAAAMWIARHHAALAAYPQGWMRAEATRRAILDSAAPGDAKRLGAGRLRAREALRRAPLPATQLVRQEADSASFPVLRILTGLGVAAAPVDPRQRMLELEALQLSQSAAIEALLPEDPEAPLDAVQQRRIAEALGADPRASQALRTALLGAGARAVRGAPPPPLPAGGAIVETRLRHAMAPAVPTPATRRLRVYAFDPSIGARLETLDINEAAIEIPWEELAPGPVGGLVEVVDVDPPSRACYAPVDLNRPELLATAGLRPSEADPRFHQQMAYAVAMKTIGHFERALGRVALWAPRIVKTANGLEEQFVPRLRIYPHALRAENAFYSPDRKALLFGYFQARAENAGDNIPGGLVFTCLSHDVVAHETTHALLDGLHRRFREPTNPDVFAFHEAFADIVALFQHFTMPEALRHQVARTRGDLRQQSLLGELAQQFGHATRGHGALRSFIGDYRKGPNGEYELGPDGQRIWVARKPERTDYANAREAHDRGAVMVAAVFDAFLQVYRRRGADLVRLATGGTGVLQAGDIPQDLVNRLAVEASKVAGHFLGMCIRALDYCPPVDITFGEYLRALITADRDLVPEDPHGYRVALVSAFRDRGIYPHRVRQLATDSVVWEPPPDQFSGDVRTVLRQMDLSWDLSVDREAVHRGSRQNARLLHRLLTSGSSVSEDDLRMLGLTRKVGPCTIKDRAGNDIAGKLRPIEVHSVRPARRVGPDGQMQADLVVELTQTWRPDAQPWLRYRGGCTLLFDLETGAARYLIRKRVADADRIATQAAFAAKPPGDSLHANYFGDAGSRRAPFAMLHGHH